MIHRRLFALTIIFVSIAGARADVSGPFIIQNNGQQAIVQIYLVPTVVQLLSGENDWGQNVLRDALPPGNMVTFKDFRSEKVPQCNYNIKLMFQDSTSQVVREFDTCKLPKLIFEP